MMWPSLASCLLFSQIAYDGALAVQPRLAQLGFGDVQVFEDEPTDTRGYRASCGTFDLVAFKGTSSLTDFLIDAQIIQTQLDGVGIHAGFCRAYDAVSYKARRASSQPMLIVGHSLGGALATLHARRMASATYVRCVTFGSPRVGDDRFAVRYNAAGIDTTRVVHADDIVPRVPKLNYHHVDGLLHIDDSGHACSGLRNWCRSLLGWDRMAHELAQRLLADLDGQALADHELANYAAAINAYLMKELAHAA